MKNMRELGWFGPVSGGNRQTVHVPVNRAKLADYERHTRIDIDAEQAMYEIHKLAEYHRRCLGQRARRLFNQRSKA